MIQDLIRLDLNFPAGGKQRSEQREKQRNQQQQTLFSLKAAFPNCPQVQKTPPPWTYLSPSPRHKQLVLLHHYHNLVQFVHVADKHHLVQFMHMAHQFQECFPGHQYVNFFINLKNTLKA